MSFTFFQLGLETNVACQAPQEERNCSVSAPHRTEKLCKAGPRSATDFFLGSFPNQSNKSVLLFFGEERLNNIHLYSPTWAHSRNILVSAINNGLSMLHAAWHRAITSCSRKTETRTKKCPQIYNFSSLVSSGNLFWSTVASSLVTWNLRQFASHNRL